jgi:hypothetical protein
MAQRRRGLRSTTIRAAAATYVILAPREVAVHHEITVNIAEEWRQGREE